MAACLVGTKAPRVQGTAFMPDGQFAELDTNVLLGKKYLLMYWYPLDFGALSTAEIAVFTETMASFEKYNVAVVGVSTDSQFAHRGLVNTNKGCGGLQNTLNHPLISDTTGKITQSFGLMIEDLGVACRGCVIVDKEGTVQAILQNSLPLGRNIKEAVRIVQALRHHEDSGEVCPANWSKGHPAMQATKEGVVDYLRKYT